MPSIRLSSGDLVQVDQEDIDYLNQWSWNIKDGYACRSFGYLTVYIHRLVFDRKCPGVYPDLIDHEDRNRLNCVRSNLRACDRCQNMANSGPSKRNTTGYKGVSFKADKKKFKAELTYYGRTIFLGYFDSADQAARAYNNTALRLFKEFASLNVIPGI